MSMNEQPDTQGMDPVEAELGEEGQGDLAPEDLPQQGGPAAALDGSIVDEDGAGGDPLDEVGSTNGGSAAPGPDDVIYGGDNVDTAPRPADDFRSEETGLQTDSMASPGATGDSSLDTEATPEGRGLGERESRGNRDRADALTGKDEVGQREAAPATDDDTGSADGSVPAGREGADAGAVDSVDVEGTASPDVERSSQNDFAGVAPGEGTDPGDAALARASREQAQVEPGPGNAAADATASPNAADDAPTAHRSDDPSIAGIPDAVGPGGAGLQTGTRQDLNDTNVDERVQGILVQVQADLGTDRLAESEVRPMLERRLTDAGISADEEQIERLVSEIVSGDAPADTDRGQPGAHA
ncbi:hypothetical protein [Microbacterium album]|uniref:Uncharacterized protein n=1 Tax=Microbacterium album TaxID=2053191 RepID=A0A917IK42_9MICO|nr:hypothetical protein [Microbacterium album]GGH50722.1 hypothetical protein GCM10010921_29660 [Microbacterium album]